MPFTISDIPFSDATSQEEIDRRRAERMEKGHETSRRAKSTKKYQVEDQEKLMFNTISVVPFDDGRRARKASRRSIAKGNKKLSLEEIEEKLAFPNLTGEFDDDSPLAKHCPRKRDQ